MDIRDIEPDVDHGKENFSRMVELQKELINHYVGIEGLPPYPVRVDLKSSQVLIKDFVGRVIEELGEGYESWETYHTMFLGGQRRDNMIPHLQNFNEECSDAVHFWLELIIYCGITEEYLQEYLQKNFDVIKDGDTLDGLFRAGRMLYYTKFGGKLNMPGFRVIADTQVPEYLAGGNCVSEERDSVMSRILWKVVYKLQIARNCLKNKPWKQTQMQTDENQFKKNILEASIYMFTFFDFVGMNSKTLYHIYYRKNRINKFRIESKY